MPRNPSIMFHGKEHISKYKIKVYESIEMSKNNDTYNPFYHPKIVWEDLRLETLEKLTLCQTKIEQLDQFINTHLVEDNDFARYILNRTRLNVAVICEKLEKYLQLLVENSLPAQ